jgi:hypothetical protein
MTASYSASLLVAMKANLIANSSFRAYEHNTRTASLFGGGPIYASHPNLSFGKPDILQETIEFC